MGIYIYSYLPWTLTETGFEFKTEILYIHGRYHGLKPTYLNFRIYL